MSDMSVGITRIVERSQQIGLDGRDVNLLPYIVIYAIRVCCADMRGKQIDWSGRLQLCYESVTKCRPQKLVFYECVY
jgi:hypothetical protein